MPFTIDFGYLPVDAECAFEGGGIERAAQYSESVAAVSARLHPDGHLYPPVVETMSHRHGSEWVPTPQSRRGALMQSLPATHVLRLERPVTADPRLGDAALVLHLLGALCGRRLQFTEWFVDGRVATREHADHYPPRPQDIGTALGHALPVWMSWSPRPRQLAVNALYLHGRAMGLEFAWDQFANQYLVADAAFRLVKETRPRWRARTRHADRLVALCDLFGIPTDGSPIEIIVAARNELFHEAQWAGGMPGMTDSQELWDACLSLQGLCLRLLYGALGLQGSYLTSCWWDRQMHLWDLRPAG